MTTMALATYDAGGPVPLIAVRPDVIAEAEHAFGNLLHRLHYTAQKLKSHGAEEAAVLEETVITLEDLLKLLLEYTSPLTVELRRVSAATVLRSIAGAMRCGQPSLASLVGAGQLMVDPGRLSQAFQLMARCLPGGEEARHLDAVVETRGHEAWLALQVATGGSLAATTGCCVVAWALAQKLVDAQGGVLCGGPGDNPWTLQLPFSEGGT